MGSLMMSSASAEDNQTRSAVAPLDCVRDTASSSLILAMPELVHHFDVETGALFKSLCLQEFARVSEMPQSVDQFNFDLVYATTRSRGVT